MSQIKTLSDFQDKILNDFMVIGYFSTPTCNVCKVLRPKIQKLIEEQFPKAAFSYIDLELVPEAQGEFLVFAVPTIIVFVDGKEIKRFSRHISVDDVKQLIERYYSILFE